MKHLWSILALSMVLSLHSAIAQYIWIDLSFKAVLNPANGRRAYAFTETNIDAAIAQINVRLAAHQRGYRFRRIQPIQDIGGVGDTTGPSKWFSVNPRDDTLATGDWDNRRQMEIEALNAPALYAWNFNAINYYVTAGYGSPPDDAGDCAFPSGNNHLIVLGTVDNGLLLLHETGHYFELYHTQGGCSCPSTLNCFLLNGYWVGDDGIGDTLPMRAGDFCFTNQNFVAMANFNLSYANCDALERNLVDDVFFNLMSYGFDRTLERVTPGQLDKWTDYANSSRANVVSGRTRFVSLNGNNANSGFSSSLPKRTVLNAANAFVGSPGHNIVLLRPGSYNEQITISNPLTIRAAPTNTFAAFPRWATIGKP